MGVAASAATLPSRSSSVVSSSLEQMLSTFTSISVTAGATETTFKLGGATAAALAASCAHLSLPQRAATR